MTGVVLVVDDVPANIKLLEAKLTNEYYDVITASDGYKAIEQAKEHKPDLILLDVMMPGMDGFEVCRQLKQDSSVAHIPVVMVTALSDPSDRVNGLEAGADDFITKPINDTALLTRVRSLIRIKMLIDELRLRDQSGGQMGLDSAQDITDVTGAHVMVIDDDVIQSKRLLAKLRESYEVMHFEDPAQALEQVRTQDWDLVIISSLLDDVDGLRLGMQIRATEDMRHVPIVMLVDEEDTNLMVKALDLGVNDYLTLPVEVNEMTARVKTQIRRKRFQDALKSNYKESMSMAITDGLTKLYNRHYLDTHMKNMVEQFHENGKPMAVVMMDMDHFKHVNDTYGHDVGDEVLIQLSQIIIDSVRSADLAARYGGEEFVILMPETDAQAAFDAADRMRRKIETTPFVVSHEIGQLEKTTSIGVSYLLEHDTAESMLKRADLALYEAKNGGRNQVHINPPISEAPPANNDAPPAEPAPLTVEVAAAPAAAPTQTPQPPVAEPAPAVVSSVVAPVVAASIEPPVIQDVEAAPPAPEPQVAPEPAPAPVKLELRPLGDAPQTPPPASAPEQVAPQPAAPVPPAPAQPAAPVASQPPVSPTAAPVSPTAQAGRLELDTEREPVLYSLGSSEPPAAPQPPAEEEVPLKDQPFDPKTKDIDSF